MPVVGAAVAGGVASARAGGHFDDIVKGAAIGGTTAAVGAGAGYELGTLGANNILAGAGAGMAAGGMGAALTGGNIGQGMLVGGVSGGMSASMSSTNGFVRVGAGAFAGGTASVMTGGTFADGAVTGAVSATVAIATQTFVSDLRDYNKNIAAYKEMAEGILGTSWSDSDKWNALIDLYNSEPFGGSIEALRNFDLGAGSENMMKFQQLHIKYEGGVLKTDTMPDKYDIVMDPIKHIAVDTLWNGFRYGVWK